MGLGLGKKEAAYFENLVHFNQTEQKEVLKVKSRRLWRRDFTNGALFNCVLECLCRAELRGACCCNLNRLAGMRVAALVNLF